MEWLFAPAAGSLGYLLLRRAPYLACYGYGAILAAQNGQTLTERDAYELGRSHIVQTAATSFLAFWAGVNWRLAWEGLVHWRNDMRAARLNMWRGLKRDWRLLLERFGHVRKTLKTEHDASALLKISEIADDPDHPEQTNAALARIETLRGLELQRKAVASRLERGEGQPGDEAMLEHITQQLYTHYRDEPVAAKMVARGLVGFGAQEVTRPQGLLASVAAGSLAWKAAAGLLASTALFFGLWRIEDAHGDKLEAANKILTANEGAYKTALAERDAAIAARDQAQTKRTANYLNELNTANTAAMQAKQQAAREKKARLDVQKATIASGGDVPLGDLLRAYPNAGDNNGPPPTASNPSP